MKIKYEITKEEGRYKLKVYRQDREYGTFITKGAYWKCKRILKKIKKHELDYVGDKIPIPTRLIHSEEIEMDI